MPSFSDSVLRQLAMIHDLEESAAAPAAGWATMTASAAAHHAAAETEHPVASSPRSRANLALLLH